MNLAMNFLHRYMMFQHQHQRPHHIRDALMKFCPQQVIHEFPGCFILVPCAHGLVLEYQVCGVP